MISEEQYNQLKKRHEEGCKSNDYSKMIMMGSSDYKSMKEYESQFCKHRNVYSIQGGQIDICRDCGKQWG